MPDSIAVAPMQLPAEDCQPDEEPKTASQTKSQRLINNNFKYSFPGLNNNSTIASIITTLRTKQIKGMKISTDGQRSYNNHCPNCPNVQLSS
ncbi:hypothetical protein TNCV_389001 [Trichonephila clavipes]|nr:hypothetical protein TNCV_389001 [Trichonephila clavipes]